VIELAHERRGSGDPLVLLHGIGHRWQAWEPVLDLLAEHHDVIAVDLPGFGASPPLPAGARYDIETAVGLVAHAFTRLGIDTPHVAGNSLGGVLAIELASAGLARSATALAPAGFWTTGDRVWALAVLRVLRQTGRVPAGVRERMAANRLLRLTMGSMLFGRPDRLTAELAAADLAAMVGSSGFDLVAEAGAGYRYSSPPPTVPVTVAWGPRDRILWPRQARTAARLLPDATMVTLPGCGHVPMGDAPDLVSATILQTCRRAPGATAGAA